MAMNIDQTRLYMTVKAAPLLQNEQVCDFLEAIKIKKKSSTQRKKNNR